MFLLLALLTAPAFAAEYTLDPMADATRKGLQHSKGDTNDTSGFEGCSYEEDSPELAPRITCSGSGTILVHGGEEFGFSFVCTHSYYFVNKRLGFRVAEESCEE